MKNRLIDKFESLERRMDSIDQTLLRNTLSLEEHIKRTNMLEEEIRPIKKHVDFVNVAAKLISGLTGLALIGKQLGLF